ncbi:multidrug DMT transporter permease [Pokkaliibacter plantistimulans]|uniref:Multidrug DMT transporter permease n=1 Tax=Pokkaliibacter plantistimulans TaxID=1635171 RepID=A0ABX5M0M2_9GAMM|nr:DMT family transporter [Pokkaliibacter plantistimulans]PXF32456.1 multidrug DMT transporter permease [Pokkaliibacter plantistimulans]
MNALLYAITVLIWGTTWIAIAMQTGDVPAPVSVFYRFVLAATVLLCVLGLSGRLKRIGGRDHLFCILQGMCVFCFNFYCFYSANRYINSGLESVLFSMAILFNAINGVIFFRQRITGKLMLANSLGIIGVVSLFWRDLNPAQMNADVLFGIGLCLLGTYGFSLGNMITARHQRNGLDLLSTNAYAMTYGAITMLVVIMVTGAPFRIDTSLSYLGALVYLAVFGSVVAFGTYFALVGRIGPGQAAYATVMFPLVALTISTLFEGYSWSSSAIVGLLLILSGNAVMFYKPRARVAVAVASKPA